MAVIENSGSDTSLSSIEREERGVWALLSSPWIWGGLLTVGLYQLIPFTQDYRPLLERYLCGHPLEYVQATLFCVGLAILIGKTVRLGVERQAAALPLPVTAPGSDGAAARQAILHGVNQLPDHLQRTWFSTRLVDLADYLRYRPSSDGLERHARHLADAAADRQHDSHSQLQTIVWAIPILGFLGTVMGITLAIANVTPEQLDTSLNSVTGGLAVAFDTTAVALTQSLLIVFASFFVRRSEARLLRDVDERIFKGLVSPVAGATQQSSPILEAETRAARELLTRTEALITEQTGLWQESVEGLRTRWTNTLDQQQRELAAALSGGVDASLGQHEQLLQSVREEFLTSYQQIAEDTLRQLGESRTLQAEQQQSLQTMWQQAWQDIREELTRERESRGVESQQLLASFADQIGRMTDQLAHASRGVEDQLNALARQTGTLAEIVGQGEQLAGLQKQLSDNLEAVRAAESLQETLHSLNAAIHLLTARTKPRAA